MSVNVSYYAEGQVDHRFLGLLHEFAGQPIGMSFNGFAQLLNKREGSHAASFLTWLHPDNRFRDRQFRRNVMHDVEMVRKYHSGGQYAQPSRNDTAIADYDDEHEYETPGELRERLNRMVATVNRMTSETYESEVHKRAAVNPTYMSVAIHEAGHCCLAIIHGCMPADASVFTGGGRAGVAWWNAGNSACAAQIYAAGAMAELEFGFSDGELQYGDPTLDGPMFDNITAHCPYDRWRFKEDAIQTIGTHRTRVAAMALRLYDNFNKRVNGVELINLFWNTVPNDNRD